MFKTLSLALITLTSLYAAETYSENDNLYLVKPNHITRMLLRRVGTVITRKEDGEYKIEAQNMNLIDIQCFVDIEELSIDVKVTEFIGKEFILPVYKNMNLQQDKIGTVTLSCFYNQPDLLRMLNYLGVVTEVPLTTTRGQVMDEMVEDLKSMLPAIKDDMDRTRNQVGNGQ